MTDTQEQQLLDIIRDTQMRSETLEIKDPEIEKILLNEIDAKEKQGVFSSVVANALRSMPRNKIVLAHDALMPVLKRSAHSTAGAQHQSPFADRGTKQKYIGRAIAFVVAFIILILGLIFSK